MAKQTTRDAALSRLFGNPAEEPDSDPSSLAPNEPESPSGAVTPQSPTGAPSKDQKDARRRNRSGGGGKSVSAPPEPAPAINPSGYIGLGRYTRADGVVERITPYVRPDQAEALRLAVARKNDPRGTDISQIVQALLDEAGYRS